MTPKNADHTIQENMASRTRHDLLQPTAAMKLLLSRLKDPISQEDRLEIVDALLRAIDDLDEAVLKICDYLMLSNGLETPKPQTIDLDHWLQKCAAPFCEQASQSGLELSLTCTLEKATLDPALGERIVRALLSNAIDFTPSGRITLWAGINTDQNVLEICVCDAGVGLRPEAEPHLAKPFYVDQAHLSRQPQRLGLGLTIAEQAAHLMGGEISVTSDPSNKGVIATFKVPL